MIESIKIIGGRGKKNELEPVRSVEFKMGDVVSIVGPTGSGKTTLINDVELFADGSTPTQRRILVNDKIPPVEYSNNPSNNPIALITQHTNFLSDLPIYEFLSIHAGIRHPEGKLVNQVVTKTLNFANQLTGEPILSNCRMTELSGGQTRALLIADAAIISDAPIVLLDEIENAGINRIKALELLKQSKKIYVFVTHDPHIALLSNFRIVMGNGMMVKIIYTNNEERKLSEWLGKVDGRLSNLREKIRMGENISSNESEAM